MLREAALFLEVLRKAHPMAIHRTLIVGLGAIVLHSSPVLAEEKRDMRGLGLSFGTFFAPLPWPAEFGEGEDAEFKWVGQSDHIFQAGGKYVAYGDGHARLAGVGHFTFGRWMRDGTGSFELMYASVHEKVHWLIGGQVGLGLGIFAIDVQLWHGTGRLQAAALYSPSKVWALEFGAYFGTQLPLSQSLEEADLSGGRYYFGGVELGLLNGDFRREKAKKDKKEKEKKKKKKRRKNRKRWKQGKEKEKK